MEGMLAEAFRKGEGVNGFAPGFQPDVDDTAKGLLSLNLLGNTINADGMAKAFEAEDRFRTYAQERDPSLSTNCIVLLALLHQADVSRYAQAIMKVAAFVCSCWWKADGDVRDKWNLCYLCPGLLLLESLSGLFDAISTGRLDRSLLGEDQLARLSISLFQACSRTLLQQADDGSWQGSVEATAYGVLILCQARRLSRFKLDGLLESLDMAIRRGAKFLETRQSDSEHQKLWIEKVSYTAAAV